MNSVPIGLDSKPTYELRFQSLFSEGRALAFPCDDGGQVPLDTLSERARINYFYARAVIGREYAVPVVRSAAGSGRH